MPSKNLKTFLFIILIFSFVSFHKRFFHNSTHKLQKYINIRNLILKKKKKTLSTLKILANFFTPPIKRPPQRRCERRLIRETGANHRDRGCQYPLCNPCTRPSRWCTDARGGIEGRPTLSTLGFLGVRRRLHMQHGREGGGTIWFHWAEVLLSLNNLGDPRRIIIVGGEEDRRNTQGRWKMLASPISLDLWPLCRRRRSCCLLSG